MKRGLIIWIVIIVIIALTVIAIFIFKSGKEVDKSSEWNREEEKLIKEGCIKIQFDGDGNTCSLNKEKNLFLACTEMLTTIPWDLPKCVEYKENA